MVRSGQDKFPQKTMPITPNETTAELQAVEQDAMEELQKKWVLLQKAVEEVQQKAWEEEEVKAWKWQEANMREQEQAFVKAKAIHQVQEEQELQGTLCIGLSP